MIRIECTYRLLSSVSMFHEDAFRVTLLQSLRSGRYSLLNNSTVDAHGKSFFLEKLLSGPSDPSFSNRKMGKVASNVDFSIQKYTSDASKTTLPVLKVEKVASNHDLWFKKSIFDASDLNFFKKNDEKWHFFPFSENGNWHLMHQISTFYKKSSNLMQLSPFSKKNRNLAIHKVVFKKRHTILVERKRMIRLFSSFLIDQISNRVAKLA